MAAIKIFSYFIFLWMQYFKNDFTNQFHVWNMLSFQLNYKGYQLWAIWLNQDGHHKDFFYLTFAYWLDSYLKNCLKFETCYHSYIRMDTLDFLSFTQTKMAAIKIQNQDGCLQYSKIMSHPLKLPSSNELCCLSDNSCYVMFFWGRWILWRGIWCEK